MFLDKKVLLRKRKRHTARHVTSGRYAALSPDDGGGYPIPPLGGWGTPPPQVWTDTQTCVKT